MMCPYTSCNDYCIVHSNDTRAEPELVGGGGGWGCLVLLHPTPTCIMLVLSFAPCTLTFGTNIPLAHRVVSPIATCTGSAFPFSHWCKYILHLHMWCYHTLQLALVVIFLPTTGANTALALKQLALCAGGLCM